MKITNAFVAAAVGGILMGCGGSTPAPADQSSAATSTAATGAAAATPAKHACKGQNDCKGQGGCKTA